MILKNSADDKKAGKLSQGAKSYLTGSHTFFKIGMKPSDAKYTWNTVD